MKMFFAAGLMALSATTAVHSATVVNGSFENISLSPGYSAGTGTMGDNLFGPINSLGYANTPDGVVAGYISSNGSGAFTAANSGSISFTLADLVVGQAYTVSFLETATSLSGISANTLSVAYNGTNIGSFTPASTNWTSATTGVFAATGTAGTLTFTGASVPSGTRSAGIDDVSISAANITTPVPEPASWAMMIGGFGIVGTAMRRRRASLSLA